MSIIATNRINTERNIEVVINFHRETRGDSVSISLYANGMSSILHLTAQEACDLQNALDRTNREFDEEDVIPEETAKDRFIESVCRPDHI